MIDQKKKYCNKYDFLRERENLCMMNFPRKKSKWLKKIETSSLVKDNQIFFSLKPEFAA